MLEIKIEERSATVTIQRDGFKIKETSAMMAHAYLAAVLAMSERGRNKEVTIKIINGFMDGLDRALCETDTSSDKLNFAKSGAGFESVFFGKFGDMNA